MIDEQITNHYLLMRWTGFSNMSLELGVSRAFLFMESPSVHPCCNVILKEKRKCFLLSQEEWKGNIKRRKCRRHLCFSGFLRFSFIN